MGAAGVAVKVFDCYEGHIERLDLVRAEFSTCHMGEENRGDPGDLVPLRVLGDAFRTSEDPGNAIEFHLQAGLLPDLPDRGIRRRLHRFNQASWDAPSLVIRVLHQQETAPLIKYQHASRWNLKQVRANLASNPLEIVGHGHEVSPVPGRDPQTLSLIILPTPSGSPRFAGIWNEGKGGSTTNQRETRMAILLNTPTKCRNLGERKRERG